MVDTTLVCSQRYFSFSFSPPLSLFPALRGGRQGILAVVIILIDGDRSTARRYVAAGIPTRTVRASFPPPPSLSRASFLLAPF